MAPIVLEINVRFQSHAHIEWSPITSYQLSPTRIWDGFFAKANPLFAKDKLPAQSHAHMGWLLGIGVDKLISMAILRRLLAAYLDGVEV